MKILLVAINAKYIHSNLAVYSLRAYNKDYKSQIQIVEYTINNYSDKILENIYKEKPDVVAFSCYIWNISMVEEVGRELKKVLPGVPIWVGGPEVSYNPRQQMEEKPWLEGVMVGEGEETFSQLVKHYIEKKEEIWEISGLYCRKENEIIDTGRRTPLSLDQIPFPYKEMKDFENKLVYYESSRGCPYSCTYCLSSIEKGIRLRSPELVKKELQFFIDAKVPLVKFIDRTFNANHGHAMDIWQYIYDHDEGFTNFHFEISADLLREDEIEFVGTFRPGLIQFEIGVQSINPTTIQAIHRKMDLNKLENAVKKVAKPGNIHQHLDLIAGLPFEDIRSFQKSFDYVYHLAPDQLQLGFLKVLKGSPMFEMSEEHQIAFQSIPPFEVLSTTWLSYGDVLELKKIEEMVEVYYNSGQFQNSINYMEHFFERPYALYEALGNYYEKHGLLEVNHNRLARYSILRDFYRDRIGGERETLDQILIFDLYLRENLKNRPEFAGIKEESKEKYQKFYRQEEKVRKLLPGYEAYNMKQISRMTHLEFFDIDLMKSIQRGKRTEGESNILFDYENRNPLNHQAAILEV
ncbi:MAG: B12-binding domain-containing radical SAM protein [Acetivibrio sp.]